MKMVMLRSGSSWCGILPVWGDLGGVVAGNSGVPGDLVEKPSELSWERASEMVEPGSTRLSPFDLQLVYDAITGWYRSDSEAALELGSRVNASAMSESLLVMALINQARDAA